MLDHRGLEVALLSAAARPAAYGVLLMLLADRLGVPETSLSLSRTAQGKPHLDGNPLEFSLSISGTLCAIAIAPRGHAVGIDVERRRPIAAASLIALQFLPEALRTEDFLVAWTVLEAGLKAAGQRLGDHSTDHAVLPHRTVELSGAVCTVAVAHRGSEFLLAGLRVTGVDSPTLSVAPGRRGLTRTSPPSHSLSSAPCH